jgi:hypothetical protein
MCKTGIGVAVMLILLSGCGAGSAINDYCVVANPIYVSKKDGFTPLTARQILDHNETGEKICKWQPKG